MNKKHSHHDHEYCEICANHKQGGKGFMDGMLLGAVIGGILGVLYAPMEGEKARKKLKRAVDEISERGQDAFERGKELGVEAKELAEPILEEIEEKVKPVLERVMESSEDVQFQVMEKIEQLVEDVSRAENKASKDMQKFFKGLKKK